MHPADSVQIIQLQQRVETLYNLLDTSNSVISNEIASSDHYLTVISIIIGVLSLIVAIICCCIGCYINSLYNKVKTIESTILEKEQTVTKLSENVLSANDKITNDLESIYIRLRREEIKANVKRLEIEPLDIKHCIHSLLSNDLEENLFEDLCNAYRKLIASGKADEGASLNDITYKEDYLLVFFQHYLYKSLLSQDLREDMIGFFKTGCKCAYERDIIKCTSELCKAINEPLDSSETILYNYLIAINNTEFKALATIKKIIETELKDKTVLRKAIDRCTNDEIYLVLFNNQKPIDDEQ